MNTWINIATSTTPTSEIPVLVGTHRYRVRGLCANGTQDTLPVGVWVTR